MVAIFMFVMTTYMDEGERYGNMDGFGYPLAMAVCIVYPYIYDSVQLMFQKYEYFYDSWNISDFIYMYAGITNIAFQFTSYYREDNHDSGAEPLNVLLLCVVLMFAMLKTLSWLRIFKSMGLLVTMVRKSFADITAFLVFFSIIILLFTLIVGVLGFQNYNVPFILNDKTFSVSELVANKPYISEAQKNVKENEEHPGIEYDRLGRFPSTLIAVFRMALGDNDMGALAYMEPDNHAMFWIVWFAISLVCQIFLLNFIIAELSNSYQVVMDNYDRLSWNQYSQLVSEADEMYPSCLRVPRTHNPRYLIIR